MQNIIYWNPNLTIDALEKQAIQLAMTYFGGNKSAASRSLGISPRSLSDKLQQYDKEALALDEARKKDAEQREILLRRSRGEKIPEESPAIESAELEVKTPLEDLPPVLPEPARKIQIDIAKASPPKTVAHPGVRQAR